MGVSNYTPTGISHATSVDFSKRSVNQPVHIVQYDRTLPILAVSLYNNGQLYRLSETMEVSIRLGKPDRTFVYNKALGCDSTRTIVYFEITQQMSLFDGELYPVIEIVDGEKIANSSTIYLVVDRNPIQHDYVESTIEYKELVDYRDEAVKAGNEAKEAAKIAKDSVQTVVDKTKEAVEASETAVNAANSASESAESILGAEENVTRIGNMVSEKEPIITAAAETASTSATNARQSEINAKDSENKAKASEEASKLSETNAKGSEEAAKLSETNAKGSENKAKASEEAAKLSETNAKGSEEAAKLSETNAKGSENKAKASEEASKLSETNAKGSENKAKASEEASKLSETNAKGSENKAKASEEASKLSETNAKDSENESVKYGNLAKSYAVGTDNTIRENDAEDNAKTYCEAAKTSAGNAKQSETNAKTYLDKIIAKVDATVDTEMSDTSENPVQNKVIKKYVDDHTPEVDDMTGATATQNGTHGLVPAPQIGDEKKALLGNGTWGSVDAILTFKTKEEYDAAVANDEIPDGAKVIKEYDEGDSTVIIDVDAEMSDTSVNPVQNKVIKKYVDEHTPEVAEMTGATADKDGTSGTVPAPKASDKDKFLRGDGTWSEAKQDLSAYYNNANYDTENNKLQLMNGDTVLKEIEISGGGGTKIVTFADGTDEEIAKMIQAHYDDKINISDYWAVGDTRSVSLSAMSATGVGESHRAQTVQFVIGDFEHDDLTTPINGHSKAAVTLLQKDCLMDASNASNPVNGSGNTENGYMNSTNTNVGGWKSCARRTWCNNVYFSALPSTLQYMIRTVNKKVSAGNFSSTIETVQDKIFLASEIEIFGSTTHSFAGEGTQYQYYKNATVNRYKNPKWSSSSVSNVYWERSPSSDASTHFCRVLNDGAAHHVGASGANGVAPCLCI